MEASNSIPSYMDNRVIMSLEEFERRYPYKVGDKVNYVKYNDGYPDVYTIKRMRWTGKTVEYVLDSNGFSALAKDLQPYKEETMEEKGVLTQIDLTKELKVEDEVEVILGDYEFVLKDGKTYFVKKKPQYPETYLECCAILGHVTMNEVRGYKSMLLDNLQMLLICRDAYWKIAGDWRPIFSDYEKKFVIANCYGKVDNIVVTNYNRILVFPTEEMRDAFYENFKELIEECKTLL